MKFFNTKDKFLSKLIAVVIALTAFLPTVQAVKPDPDSDDPKTPNDYLVEASNSGSCLLANLALKNGATNMNNVLLDLCLHEWYYNGYKNINVVGIVELLLDRGADVNVRTQDKESRTALMVAVRATKPNYEMVRVLLDQGAEVNARDYAGWTPLMFACYKGHRDIAELLLDHGAEINASNDGGYTPLMLASKGSALMYGGDMVGTVKLLLERGADVNQRSDDDKYCAKSFVAKIILDRSHYSDKYINAAEVVYKLLCGQA